MVGWLRVPWVVATCATLVVWVTTTPAVAQPRHEVELGGGFLSSTVPDNVQLPSVPTLDARAVGGGAGVGALPGTWWSESAPSAPVTTTFQNGEPLAKSVFGRVFA